MLESCREHSQPLEHNHLLKTLWCSSGSGSTMTLPDNCHAQLGVSTGQGVVLLGSLDDVTLVGGGKSAIAWMWDALFQLASVLRTVLGMFNL